MISHRWCRVSHCFTPRMGFTRCFLQAFGSVALDAEGSGFSLRVWLWSAASPGQGSSSPSMVMRRSRRWSLLWKNQLDWEWNSICCCKRGMCFSLPAISCMSKIGQGRGSQSCCWHLFACEALLSHQDQDCWWSCSSLLVNSQFVVFDDCFSWFLLSKSFFPRRQSASVGCFTAHFWWWCLKSKSWLKAHVCWFWSVEVSWNGGTPKWMVYNGKSYLNGWCSGHPSFRNPQYFLFGFTFCCKISSSMGQTSSALTDS